MAHVHGVVDVRGQPGLVPEPETDDELIADWRLGVTRIRTAPFRRAGAKMERQLFPGGRGLLHLDAAVAIMAARDDGRDVQLATEKRGRHPPPDRPVPTAAGVRRGTLVDIFSKPAPIRERTRQYRRLRASSRRW